MDDAESIPLSVRQYTRADSDKHGHCNRPLRRDATWQLGSPSPPERPGFRDKRDNRHEASSPRCLLSFPPVMNMQNGLQPDGQETSLETLVVEDIETSAAVTQIATAVPFCYSLRVPLCVGLHSVTRATGMVKACWRT